MRYKRGDRVKIKSLDWYNQNKNEDGFVHCGNRIFDDYMSVFCGSVVTICGTCPYYGYDVREDMQCRTWTDEMIEGLVDVEPQEKLVKLDDVVYWLENNVNNYIFVDDTSDTWIKISSKLFDDIRKAMGE